MKDMGLAGVGKCWEEMKQEETEAPKSSWRGESRNEAPDGNTPSCSHKVVLHWQQEFREEGESGSGWVADGDRKERAGFCVSLCPLECRRPPPGPLSPTWRCSGTVPGAS